MSTTVLTAPGDGPNPQRLSAIENLELHPNASYSSKPKGPVEYVLVHKPPSWLLPVKNDKRDRTSAEYQDHFVRVVGDVKQRGVQQSVIAVREGDAGRIIDGETRRLAALYAGCEVLPILLYKNELSEADLVLAQLQANAMRRDFTALELAALYAQLMQLNGWSQAQLARAVQVSPAQIAKVLAVSTKLCEEVRAMVSSAELAPRAAYAISRLPDVQIQLDLAKAFKAGRLCVEGVESNVAAKLNGKSKVKKPKPIVVSIGGVTFTTTEIEPAKVQAAVDVFKAGIMKLDQNNLPMSALPNVLKNA